MFHHFSLASHLHVEVAKHIKIITALYSKPT